MKRMLLVVVLSLVLLAACTPTSQQPTQFPPPEGYSSWEEYNQAQGISSPTITTKGLILKDTAEIDPCNLTAMKIYLENNPQVSLPLNMHGYYYSSPFTLQPGQEARVTIESQTPIVTQSYVWTDLALTIAQIEPHVDLIRVNDWDDVYFVLEDYIVSGNNNILKLTIENTGTSASGYMIYAINMTSSETKLTYKVELTGNTINFTQAIPATIKTSSTTTPITKTLTNDDWPLVLEESSGAQQRYIYDPVSLYGKVTYIFDEYDEGIIYLISTDESKVPSTLVYFYTGHSILSGSLSNIQLGDLILISGHILIYDTITQTTTGAISNFPGVVASEITVIEREDDIGSTRNNPVPRGQSLIHDGIEITVVDVISGSQAWNIIKNANMFNDAPSTGYEYIIVIVKVKNIYASEPYDVDYSDFSILGSSNVQVKTYDRSVVMPKDGDMSELDARLFQGGEKTGSAAFYIHSDQDDLVLISDLGISFTQSNLRYFSVY